jgi:hypothetical protein
MVTASTWEASAMSIVEILLIVAAVVYVIAGRLAGQPLQAKRLVVIPAAMTIYGLTHLPHLDAIAIAGLAVEAAIGFGLGLLRGVTIHVYEKAGHLWFRYRPLTLAVWVATIAVRVVIAFGAHLVGVNLPTMGAILVSLGLSLFGEAAVIATRAQRLGVPYAPGGRAARVLR